MKFYINKYPVITCHNYDGENETLPIGLAFTIAGISNSGYSLKPVKKIVVGEGKPVPTLEFTPELIRSAFTEVDYLSDGK